VEPIVLTKDKQARLTVTELERSQGAAVSSPPNCDKSYDLLIKRDLKEIHGEVKGSEPRCTWIGINGLGALCRLLEDPDYRLYFCVIGDDRAVLKCQAALVLKFLDVPLTEIKKLHEVTKHLANSNLAPQLGFCCRIQFHLPLPISELITQIEKLGPTNYGSCVDGIWRFQGGTWKQTFPAIAVHVAAGDD
jgi:hypothetical protein